MDHFDIVKRALEYIDGHFAEPLDLGSIAKRFHFSAYYFHRIFSAVVGKTMAIHIRNRRLLHACVMLHQTDQSILEIGFDCGYRSAQSFSRAFTAVYGVPPSEYRKQGFAPAVVTVEEMIMKFTNRLKGGVFVNPKIIKRSALFIAGVSGDGNDTAGVWNAFELLRNEKPLPQKLAGNGYEIRIYDGDACTVHVGFAIPDSEVTPPYDVYKLPASQYASFDVFVTEGYHSENNAMNQWLQTNSSGYRERLLGQAHYCVEYYDERFCGNEAGSIVEIWIPIEKK